MKVTWLPPTDPRWAEFLARATHDFYHLPGYVAAEAHRLGGEAGAVWVESEASELFMPLVVREIPRDWAPDLVARDALAPYGYPAPIVTGDSSGAAANARAAFEFLGQRGICSVFLRMHPLLGGTDAALRACGESVDHGSTVWVDLTLSDDELRRQTRKGHRADITKLLGSGAEARIDARGERFEEFIGIYHETMRSIGADPTYFFDRRYFEDLRAALGDRLELCVVERQTELLCAGLFTRVNDLAQYHLSGTADRWRREGPNKLMLQFMIQRLKAQGAKVLHLGGGVGGQEDSLFGFKAGFSPLRAPFRTLRVVTEPALYRQLVARRLGPEAGAAGEESSFFPLYRKAPSAPR